MERMLGPYEQEERNYEELLIEFCMRNDLKIMNGFFQQRNSHRYTRYKWNQNTGGFEEKSEIDYIITSYRRVTQNIKVSPGLSVDSDQRLLIGNIKIMAEKLHTKEKRSVTKVEEL